MEEIGLSRSGCLYSMPELPQTEICERDSRWCLGGRPTRLIRSRLSFLVRTRSKSRDHGFGSQWCLRIRLWAAADSPIKLGLRPLAARQRGPSSRLAVPLTPPAPLHRRLPIGITIPMAPCLLCFGTMTIMLAVVMQISGSSEIDISRPWTWRCGEDPRTRYQRGNNGNG